MADWRLKMKMVGEVCGWLAFEDEDGGRGKMKMVGEGCGC